MAEPIPDIKHTGFKKYKKKPIVIQATILLEDTNIETLEGTIRGRKGDYLIIGVKGEIYPCRPDIFQATYEETNG